MKQLIKNGTLRHISFYGSVICLVAFFAVILLQTFITGITDYSWYAPLCVILFFLMVLFLVSGFFLPAKQYQAPKRENADSSEFSNQEREALLQESWLSNVERFNKNRVR